MYKISSLFCSILIFTGIQVGQAQNLGNSPYSKLGIGEINTTTGSLRNFGMGNLGVSTPHSFTINIQNPALLYYNSRVTFEVAAAGQVKNIANATRSETSGDAGLGYIALSLPVAKSWRTAIGVRPFSSVNYNSSSQDVVPNDPNHTGVLTGNNGDGILTEAYFSNGVRLYKGLTVGITGSYLFGGINRNAYTQLQDSAGLVNPQRVVISDQTNFSDVMFRGGIAYRHTFGKKLNATFGAVYGLKTDLNYRRETIQERRRVLDGAIIDAVSLGDSTRGHEVLPGFWEAGVSLDNNTGWVVGVEVGSRKWSGYRTGTGASDPNIGDSFRFAVGGELTPDATSVTSYLKRVSYRTGFNYTQSPYMPNGQQLNDMSIHFGATLPLGTVPRPPEYNQSFINLGLALGKIGTTENNLLRENYIRFMIGISLNSSWFIKPKFE